MATVVEWTLAIISDVVHVGFIIAILNTLRRFCMHRHFQALQKRSPLLVYLMNICCIFYLFYHITWKIAYIVGVWERDWNFEPILNDEQVGHPQIIGIISAICYIFSFHGMAVMWIARSWIIYFNCRYGLQIQRSKWSMHLNDRYQDTLWFVKHRKDYGSNRVVYRIAITSYIIHALFQAFLWFKYRYIWLIYDSACWLIEFTILVVIWYKIPSFNDIFGIKKEMQWMFRVAGIALLLWIAWTVKVMVFGYNLWMFMSAEFIFGIMAGIMALILNGFIFHNPNYKHLVSTTLESSMFTQISTGSSGNILTGGKLSLLEVLENEQLIDCFFEHLIDEFSVELLLALIEFKQFHDLMRNDEEFMAGIQGYISGNAGDARISQRILSKIPLAAEIPKSKIVHENHREISNHIKRYLAIAHDLFDKYVSNKAEFQLNLSYRCRQKIKNFIQQQQQYNNLLDVNALKESEQLDLFVLFNEATNELCRLLRSSHDRCFKANKCYPNSTLNIV